MGLGGTRIGWCVTGAFGVMHRVLAEMERIVKEGADVTVIASVAASTVDTRHTRAADLLTRMSQITGKRVLTTLADVEPVGPSKMFDVLLVAPCTGNTAAKIANAITDGPVTMAVKAHLRNGRPVVLSLSSNDLLGMNAKNLGVLLGSRNFYFVPFGQDNPEEKPTSLDADTTLIADALVGALAGRQIQPMLIDRRTRR